MDFDLTKSYFCSSFVEGHTAKGVGLRVADSHTGNYREDDFTQLDTIRRFLGIIESRSLSSSHGRPSSWREEVNKAWSLLAPANSLVLAWKQRCTSIAIYAYSNAGESLRRSHKAINRDRYVAEARLLADYFGPSLKYPDYYFRRQYRMNRSLFLKIVQGIEKYIETHYPLPAHFDFFVVRPEATGLMGFSVIMKCASAIRQLAYGTSPDALDEYLQMGEHCARDCLDCFTMCIIDLFTPEFLRKPDVNDVRKLYDAHNRIHGLSGVITKYPTIMLEAVASYDLWIWYAFFGVACANNDLTVLKHSLLFDDLLDDISPVVPFEVNGVTFEKGGRGRPKFGSLLREDVQSGDVDLRSLPFEGDIATEDAGSGGARTEGALQEKREHVMTLSPATFVAEESSLNDKNWSDVATIPVEF
nr:hypothetical protein [Tanacetum cinerariifolium]